MTVRESKLCLYEIQAHGNTVKIKKTVKESGLVDFYTHYYHIDKNNHGSIKPLDLKTASLVVSKALLDDNISSALVITETGGPFQSGLDFDKKSDKEELYTSTGIKFWKHQRAMESYKGGAGHSIISTHISPEGNCNLRCPYCSVTNRGYHNRIAMEDIVCYVEALMKRGLKAVIITGGGEPMLYPKINQLLRCLKFEQGLDVALITNGTLLNKLDKDVRQIFSWVRVSVNIFKGWQKAIHVPDEILNSPATIGFSYIYTSEHAFEGSGEIRPKDIFQDIQKLMDRYRAQYLRVLPNCLIMGDDFDRVHAMIHALIQEIGDPRIFHQLKKHHAPRACVCHQSYFRPYLSEEINPLTHKSGTVFPCDSIVLNNASQRFLQKYALCEPQRVTEYLDRKIQAHFDPSKDCQGCVFTHNLDLIENFLSNKDNQFLKYQAKDLAHENFV